MSLADSIMHSPTQKDKTKKQQEGSWWQGLQFYEDGQKVESEYRLDTSVTSQKSSHEAAFDDYYNADLVSSDKPKLEMKRRCVKSPPKLKEYTQSHPWH